MYRERIRTADVEREHHIAQVRVADVATLHVEDEERIWREVADHVTDLFEERETAMPQCQEERPIRLEGRGMRCRMPDVFVEKAAPRLDFYGMDLLEVRRDLLVERVEARACVPASSIVVDEFLKERVHFWNLRSAP